MVTINWEHRESKGQVFVGAKHVGYAYVSQRDSTDPPYAPGFFWETYTSGADRPEDSADGFARTSTEAFEAVERAVAAILESKG